MCGAPAQFVVFGALLDAIMTIACVLFKELYGYSLWTVCMLKTDIVRRCIQASLYVSILYYEEYGSSPKITDVYCSRTSSMLILNLWIIGFALYLLASIIVMYHYVQAIEFLNSWHPRRIYSDEEPLLLDQPTPLARCAPTPTPNHILATFPLEIIQASDTEGLQSECIICWLTYKEGDVICTLVPCKHKMHDACIKRWLRMHSTCPMCRYDFSNTSNSVVVETSDLCNNEQSNSDMRRLQIV